MKQWYDSAMAMLQWYDRAKAMNDDDAMTMNDDDAMTMKRWSTAPSSSRLRTVVTTSSQHCTINNFAHLLFEENGDKISL